MGDDAPQDARPLTILSYNLWHGKAQRELGPLVDAHDPDVLCVQEASSASLPQRLGALQLAVTTTRNRLAVALYTKAARFEIESAHSYNLAVTRHDRLVGGTEQRLAAARVNDTVESRRVVLGSFHATPFTDSNAARRRSVDEAHAHLTELGPGMPALMAGDYNHPIQLFMLRLHLARQGVTLASTPTGTFHREGNLMRGKFDLASMTGLTVVSAAALPQGASDHKPVLFTAKYSD